VTLNEEMELYDSICSPCRHYNDEDDSYCMKCRKVEKAIQKKNQPTHRELCELGARFILMQRHCQEYPWRILIEPGYRKELPDVFGFSRYYSILIECKASRADFLRDRKKPFRQHPEQGIGARRYYLCNEGVATQDEMPEGWQLLTALDKDTITLPFPYRAPVDSKGYDFDIRNATAEVELMWSWEYRKNHNCLPVFPTEAVNIRNDTFFKAIEDARAKGDKAYQEFREKCLSMGYCI